MNRDDILVADSVSLGHTLARDFLAHGALAIKTRGQFTIALPGGSVATNLFPYLAAVSLDWSRTDFFWVDERAVSPSSPDSNYRLARTLWLEPVAAPAIRIHRIITDDGDLEGAALNYADVLRRVAGDPPRLDYVLLGTGPDGHVASIFSGLASQATEPNLVVVVDNAPKPPPRRVTLTLPVLTNARRVAIIALGREKASAIAEAVNNEDAGSPLARVIRHARSPWLLLDHDAGALL
jgi:6-phosphogluconolactonase